MTEEIRTELAQLADRLVDHTARANLIRAQLREEEERLERIVQRTRIHQRIEKLREQVAAVQAEVNELEEEAKNTALAVFGQTDDKHPHDLFTIEEHTSVVFDDEDGLYEYAQEKAPDLMVVRPAHKGTFTKWVKGQVEADKSILEFVSIVAMPRPVVSRSKIAELAAEAEVRVNVTTAFSHKAFAELTEARAFEIVQKEQEEAARIELAIQSFSDIAEKARQLDEPSKYMVEVEEIKRSE